MIKKVLVGNEKYKVLIGKNKIIKDYLPSAVTKNNNILIISDKNIPDDYIELVRKSIPSSKVIDILKIKPGEQSKSFSNFQMILNKLAKKKYDRLDCIVAIGGGVVGDLSGFVAASYMRGIDYIQVPTSLLAQVDSSVGGKTAINIESGKNLVGAFKNPKLVLISSTLLKTLPEREFKSGIAEIIKYGLIYNKKIFNIFEKQHKQILKRNQKIIEELIHESVKTKAKIVTEDEREFKSGLAEIIKYGLIYNKKIFNIFDKQHKLILKRNQRVIEELIHESVKTKAKIVTEDEREFGIRAILNFGHTYGHAMEAINNLSLIHI